MIKADDLIPFLTRLDGRVSRQAYWFGFFLPAIAIQTGAGAIEGRLSAADGSGLLSQIVALALLWPFIAVTVKRFHDRSLKAVYVAGFIGAMAAAGGVSWAGLQTETFWVSLLGNSLHAMIVPAFFYLLLALPGIPEENAFGPDPRERDQA